LEPFRGTTAFILGRQGPEAPALFASLTRTYFFRETFMEYLGHLSRSDPLYEYLRHAILPQLGANGTKPDFRVYQITASNHVYLYQERRSKARVIGKFYGGIMGRLQESACRRMEREFNNLNYIRSLGFSAYPHYIPKPLGRNAGLNCVLVEESCNGVSLNDLILKAIREGGREPLFRKLSELAYFLASLHIRTAGVLELDFKPECLYFDRIARQLMQKGYIGFNETQEFCQLKDYWRQKGFMGEDRQVLLHGDVTPPNILFGDEHWVIAVDLERMKMGDRVFDLGRIAGEIKHFFMQYAGHFRDQRDLFSAITRRLPFYMGLNLMRIARNSWFDNGYRRQLLQEAQMTLR
jgi:hypothetical protein